MARVCLPSAWREATGGVEAVEVTGATVGELVARVDERYPGFRAAVCQGDRLRPGLAVSLDGAVAPLGLRQPVIEPVEVHFLPALGGG